MTVWLLRQFNGGLSNEPDDPQSLLMVRKAGLDNITGARSYNYGLRAIYFSIAFIAWLVGPRGLIAANIITVGVLLRGDLL